MKNSWRSAPHSHFSPNLMREKFFNSDDSEEDIVDLWSEEGAELNNLR